MADGSRTPYASLVLWHDAVTLLETAYQQAHGELTDEVRAIEALAELKREQALEAFAKFIRGIDHSQAAIDAERERLDDAAARLVPRKAWAERQLLALLELEGQTKAVAGSFRISTRAGSRYVHVSKDVDLESLPPSFVRWSDPVPPQPSLDKKAVREYLESPDAEPIAGLSLEQKPRTVKID